MQAAGVPSVDFYIATYDEQVESWRRPSSAPFALTTRISKCGSLMTAAGLGSRNFVRRRAWGTSPVLITRTQKPALRKTLPDDQRFFFEAIMPSRDGSDAAFLLRIELGNTSRGDALDRRRAADAIHH